METFGQMLKKDRERLELTQGELAERLGVSQQAVASWENDAAMPKQDRRAALLQVLGPTAELVRNPPTGTFLQGVKLTARATVQDSPIDTVRENLTRYGTPASGSVMDRLKEQRRIQEEKRTILVNQLDEGFRANLDQRLEIGPTRRFVDYLSDKLVIEIKYITHDRRPYPSLLFSQSLLQLAVIKAYLTSAGPSDRQFILMLIVNPEAPLRNQEYNRLVFDAGLLGISIAQVTNPHSAAKLIMALESDSLDHPDDLDDEEIY
jgi:transcriptional regulator with XRE-family HTH domain